MKMAIGALLLIVFGLTVLDIAVVETVYRPTSDWGNIWKYHLVYWTLIVTLPLVAAYFTKSLIPLVTYILFFFGIEDTLFYGLQGYLPETYWGVNIAAISQPDLFTVLVLNVVGLCISAVVLVVLWWTCKGI